MGLRENIGSVENISRYANSIIDTIDGMEECADAYNKEFLRLEDEEARICRKYEIISIAMIVATILICIFVV